MHPLSWAGRAGGPAEAPAARRATSELCCPAASTWSSAPTTAASTRLPSPLPERPSATRPRPSMRRGSARTAPMQARDVMTREVVTVAPTTSVKAVAEILATLGFSAVPVVDDNDRLVGIVSEADVLRDRMPVDPRLRLRRDVGTRSAPPPVLIQGVMTADVRTVEPGADVAD